MTYQEFKDSTIHTISTKLGPDFKIALQDILKNNDTHLDGLVILSEHSNVSPTIYLNYYYRQYLSGRSLSDIYEDILISYRKNALTEKIDISFFTDFCKVKKHITFKLVNYERNKELLSRVPHVRYLDLAIVFHCLLNHTAAGYGTILIHHHHLSFWNISTEELYTLAMENTPKLLPYHLQSMAEVLADLFCGDALSSADADFPPFAMYVLSNTGKINGSGSILYKDLLADIADKIGSDFYILPSSIHEVLLIPVRQASSYAELSAMVKEVNAVQLSRDEILSDHVYYYSRCSGKITM